ncbi:MAG: response regulator [Bacteroidota bacterium]
MVRIYIIDDHFLIGSGFKEEFNGNIDDIEIAGSAIDVLTAIKEIRQFQINIQIIVLDLFIKFLDPIANYRLLHENFPLIPIVILSHESSPEWQIKMFKQGIKGFVTNQSLL